MKFTTKNSKSNYNPNLGFIGNSEVKVSNYLFSGKQLRKAYQHAEPVVQRILGEEVRTHYKESKKLTQFLKNRDLTFSKKMPNGQYKEFVVPCTTTVIPLQKSLFNEVEVAAQKLMVALRKVLQDIYGSKSLKQSEFITSLPANVRKNFIDAIKTSPSYFPQLHHPNMREYPFLDNVGLDLVLVEDYLQKSNSFPELISKNKDDELPGLPFRILEINAGSPSGASNNMNILEGLHKINPNILNSLGKLHPNDHFQVLGETYKSLGENWTGIKDGVQILLPPGGQNGASPEIHQLAAYSGLIYTDPDQLYQDKEGYIRLRTVGENPIVTAIYSRVNADSALFDPKKKIFLRDPDTGEPIYFRDALKLDKNGQATIVTDANGRPLPLQSAYKIPGAADAIISKKLYMGGLNRIVDNKIILATLTHYAPKFYNNELKRLGIDSKGPKILPPQTLPPTRESVETICANPDEWVVKAPSLAGGQGVYILKTLPKDKKEEVLEMIQEKPQDFAYQQLVKIARIPVAVSRKDGYRFANLAADIRMWVFFGGGKNELPRITHNALVRYAPQEKGKMSSIVNTSAGGGYAPFVIVDDINSPNAISADELVKPKIPVPHQTRIPVFVGAQMVQISRMLKEAVRLLNLEKTCAYELLGLALSLKVQLKEVLSFFHPRVIENIYKIIDILEAKNPKKEIARFYNVIEGNQVTLVELLKKTERHLPRMFRDTLDNIRVLNRDVINTFYTDEDRALDMVMVRELRSIYRSSKIQDAEVRKNIRAIIRVIESSVTIEPLDLLLPTKSKRKIMEYLENFSRSCQRRLSKSESTIDFVELFSMDPDVTQLRFETLYLGERDTDKEIQVATQFEMRTKQILTESDYIAPNLKAARKDWLEVLASASLLKSKDRATYLRIKREEHFKKHPSLVRYQQLINSRNLSANELIELLPVVPYAKFNIEQFARANNTTVENIFTSSLKANRLSLLTTEQLQKHKLGSREHAGECFAKKKQSHGLYSESNIYIWLRSDLDPFTILYTAGHEIIHYHQLQNSMKAEKRAVADGGASMAKFLNYYGNFLGANRRALDEINFSMQPTRKPLYGYIDRCVKDFFTPVISELRVALQKSDDVWDKKLESYGSLFGYMTPTSPATRVKALQEVLPALENAKNIQFATELGLDIDIDPVKAALPSANKNQLKYYRDSIFRAIYQPGPEWEALRIIASHQYHGIQFFRADREKDNLTLIPTVTSIAIGASYNQTQQ